MDSALVDKDANEIFHIEMTLPAYRLTQSWHMCGKIANYLSAYVSYQFQELERAENIISMVMNELLEGLIILCPVDSQLVIILQQEEECLRIYLQHNVHSNLIKLYCSFIKKIRDSSAQEQDYINMLTGATSFENDFNQLGLCMIICNFGARFIMPVLDSVTNRIETVLEIPNKEFVG